MIREICQFVETLEEQTPDIFEKGSKLREGIYIALDIGLENEEYILKNVDENGFILKEDIGLYTKNDDLTPFFEKCRMVLQVSKPVSPAKIFNPSKKIFNMTCNPFALGFTKKIFDKNLIEIGFKGIENELFNQYFKKASEFVQPEDEETFEGFKKFFKEKFRELILIFHGVTRFSSLMNEDFMTYSKEIGLEKIKDSFSIVFYLKKDLQDFKIPYQMYLGQNVFNKSEYNATYDEITYGISDSLSSFNDKKRFLKHQSASFRFNYRIHGEDAQLIWKFYQLSRNKQLPNPLPIFIDKDESNLNADVVKLFNNDGVSGYSEIIRSLLNLKKTNLQNFYLLFIHKGQIIDLDFVPVFKYTLKDKAENDFEVKEIFGKEPTVYFNSKEHNIFDFQLMVMNPIFNKQLIQETKAGTLWLKYFDDLEIKPDFGLTDVIYNLMYKYRKAWYDFIYKSKQQEITMTMINEMFKDSIMDDLRHDNEFQKTPQIRKKLSLWFGLQPLFDNIFNTKSMANKTVELQTKIREIAQTESLHIETDDEFAFATGQLIWKLLIQSESANRSHALLEPFLQKTEPKLFKHAVANTFNMYKHKFPLYPNKYEFDKLFSEVMGYDPDVSNMKEHLPMIFAGYFSDSIFKKQ